MRIAAIGDIHGRNYWKIFESVKDQYDKIIFIGDYVDSFNIDDNLIIKNLNEIIEFKKQNLKKVELLLGNHDNQYLFDSLQTRCSGFRQSISSLLSTIFKSNEKLFTCSYQYQDLLFTHGGLINKFYLNLIQRVEKGEEQRYSDYLNFIGKNKISLLLDVSLFRGGKDKYSGIFWADWIEMITQDFHLPINQVIGHSARYGGEHKKINDDHFIIDIDILDKEKVYFEFIQNDKWEFKKIKIE
jgi:predicted phosphodiesterase